MISDLAAGLENCKRDLQQEGFAARGKVDLWICSRMNMQQDRYAAGCKMDCSRMNMHQEEGGFAAGQICSRIDMQQDGRWICSRIDMQQGKYAARWMDGWDIYHWSVEKIRANQKINA